MKLKRFKEKDQKTIGIMVFTVVCILLVSGVILYQTFAIFEVKTNQNVIKGNVQDPGDIYFAFYVDNQIQRDMPKKEEGYMLDKDQSYCEVNGTKDPSIIPSLDRDTWSIVVTGITSSRTKCNLYFKKTYDNNTLYDLSGNNYNGTFIGNVEVKKDGDLMGIYFDGVDDYVEVSELPETIDWESGFTVEAEFKAISLAGWDRIYDFGGSGPDDNNFLFAVGVNSHIEVSIRNENNNLSAFIYNDFLYENEKYKIKVVFDKLKESYVGKIYKNDIFFDSQVFDTTNLVKNMSRKSNYLGKSNWIEEKNSHFHGYIYSLKFIDSQGKTILWYDF